MRGKRSVGGGVDLGISAGGMMRGKRGDGGEGGRGMADDGTMRGMSGMGRGIPVEESPGEGSATAAVAGAAPALGSCEDAAGEGLAGLEPGSPKQQMQHPR